MKHLLGLNSPQKEAVLQTNGPILIVAGAGAGKTKTITHRILNLIKNGVAPHSILAITFTNKSAKEMKERVEKLLDSDHDLNLPVSMSERPFVSTFHALGVHILKENATTVGILRHFNIFDKSDSKKSIKEATTEAQLDPKQFDAGIVQNIISRNKGDFVTAEEFEAKAGTDYFPAMVARIWKKYELILKKENALDFDDLLLKTAKLLQNNPTVLEHYQNIWKYIHIDEYQDTNKVQYKIAKLLSEKYGNICVVGDADQNIYSWRGAQIKNILDFEKDFPGAKVVLLEENYRSTKNILKAANSIIVKNKFRKEKNLFTSNAEGEKIGLFEGYDEASEASFIARRAGELIKKGSEPKEIAVLYRANFQSRAIEEAFLAENISYQLLGTRFFERKEVKDVLSFIRAGLNSESLSDIKRIINVPTRGIGKVTLIKFFANEVESLPKATQQKISDFRNLIKNIGEETKTKKPSKLVKFVIEKTGLEISLKTGNDEDAERLENIYELVTLATKYDELPMGEGVEKLLTDAALASDQDELTKEKGGVKLMTVHSAKGLEFDYVFIAGLEDNLFPHKRFGEERVSGEESEEERRLFYVAITRARKKVFLTYASIRTIFGARQVNIPSEFITDIDDEIIEKEEVGGDERPRKPLLSIDF